MTSRVMASDLLAKAYLMARALLSSCLGHFSSLPQALRCPLSSTCRICHWSWDIAVKTLEAPFWFIYFAWWVIVQFNASSQVVLCSKYALCSLFLTAKFFPDLVLLFPSQKKTRQNPEWRSKFKLYLVTQTRSPWTQLEALQVHVSE